MQQKNKINFREGPICCRCGIFISPNQFIASPFCNSCRAEIRLEINEDIEINLKSYLIYDSGLIEIAKTLDEACSHIDPKIISFILNEGIISGFLISGLIFDLEPAFRVQTETNLQLGSSDKIIKIPLKKIKGIIYVR